MKSNFHKIGWKWFLAVHRTCSHRSQIEFQGSNRQKEETHIQTKDKKVHELLHLSVHPTRRVDYSASFSRFFRGSFWRCTGPFGDCLVVMLTEFRKENYSTSTQKNCKNLYFSLSKIASDGLFIEGSVLIPNCLVCSQLLRRKIYIGSNVS